MGVFVHSPHQWLAFASRDPRQASSTPETQSRAPSSRICKLIETGMAVTSDLILSFSRQKLTFPPASYEGVLHQEEIRVQRF